MDLASMPGYLVFLQECAATPSSDVAAAEIPALAPATPEATAMPPDELPQKGMRAAVRQGMHPRHEAMTATHDHWCTLEMRFFRLNAQFPPPEPKEGLCPLWDGARFLGFVGGPKDPIEQRQLEQSFRELGTAAGIAAGFPPARALEGWLDLLRRDSVRLEPNPLGHIRNVVLASAQYCAILASRALSEQWPPPAAAFVPPQIASSEISPLKPAEIPAASTSAHTQSGSGTLEAGSAVAPAASSAADATVTTAPADTSDLKQSGETEPGGDRQVPAEADSGREGVDESADPVESQPDVRAEPSAKDYRAIVDAFIDKVLAETGTRITRKNIYNVAGYTDQTEFLKFQRDECSSPGARDKFMRILKLEPEEFLNRLKVWNDKNAK
jgi:hypothetical protein